VGTIGLILCRNKRVQSMNPLHSAPATLAELSQAGVARIRFVQGDDNAAMRLRELGFTPGTEVSFCRQAPFGGPIVVALRGYQLCLRVNEAKRVLIETIGDQK